MDTPNVRQALQLAQNHRQAGRLEEAERVCRGLLDTEPDNPEVWHLLGLIAHQGGNFEMAAELFEEAIRLGPAKPDHLNNLGGAYQALGRMAEAEKNFRAALKLKPDHVLAQNNLGIALHALGRLEEAEQSFRRSAALRPDYAEAHNNLGNVLGEVGRLEEAERSFAKALSVKPDYAEAHGNLGIALRSLGRLEEAERSFRKALALKPGYAEAHSNLGATLFGLGRLEEAERSFRQALALDADFVLPQRNLLFLLNYVSGRGPAEIYAAHRDYARRHYPSGESLPHGNRPDPGRKLHVGYVSGDLRHHPVAYFIEPVLAKHDRSGYEVFCYHNSSQSDAVTARLKAVAGQWRDVFELDDDALVKLIRDDAIDILVDLSGHTLHNRLSVFARKAAPVQVSWLGYLNTTGLDAMDYRITDRHASPEGLLDAYHSEKLIRLPDSQWCYQPPAACPEVSPPPSASAGRITFAAFATPAKMGPEAIEVWCRLLERVPGSQLLVVTNALAAVPADYAARFTRHGVSKDRLTLLGTQAFPEYLALHRSVDVLLDTFPYSSGTTACHALWMGVPVVTLAGETVGSRGGASLLHAIGLSELVAQTPEQYIDTAAALAGDAPRLAALRAGLRERLRASPLMDAERFTRNLETAYRAMWRTWCSSQSLPGRIAAGMRKIFRPSG